VPRVFWRDYPLPVSAFGRGVRAAEDDFGMEECSGDAGGDGDEVALSVEDFDLARVGEFGKVDSTSVADTGDGGVIGSNGWKLGKKPAGVDE
jgi:hypothetical protein